MTRDQNRALYGAPAVTTDCPCCEDWFYTFKNRRVPLPGQPHAFARIGTFIFANGGGLEDFSYDR